MKTFESINEWIAKNNFSEKVRIYKDKDFDRRDENAIIVHELETGALFPFVESDYEPEKLFDKVFKMVKKIAYYVKPEPKPIVIDFGRLIK